MTKPLTIVLCVALVLSIAFNGYLYQSLQKSPEVIYLDPPITEKPTVDEPEFLFVHISGAVNNPGVYTLPVGSRAFTAVERAGGHLADANLESVNLARVLFDGEKLHIHGKTEVEVGQASVPVVQGDKRININTASQKDLEALPGIGPAKSAAIVTYRTQNGPFRKLEDLINVPGIGDKTYESLKHLIRLS